MQAEVEGLICSGPRAGAKLTYALLAERAPYSRELAGDEALAELTRRYFASHAPATVQDFSWWSGLSIAECRRGIEMVGKELDMQRIDDVAYHGTGGIRAATRRVHVGAPVVQLR